MEILKLATKYKEIDEENFKPYIVSDQVIENIVERYNFKKLKQSGKIIGKITVHLRPKK